MERIVVLSTDNNPNYFFYLPIVTFYWRAFGWRVICFAPQEVQQEYPGMEFREIPIIPGVRPGTCAQTVRHFAANVLPQDSYIMVQDIDLIPLQPYNPDLTRKTIYGWEMTGKTFIPVHYTGMPKAEWMRIMECTGDIAADMEREMKANGRAYKEKWEDYWDTDWDILTKKVLTHTDEFLFIPRGMVKCGRFTVPMGRVDRCSIQVAADGSYSWGDTLNQTSYIDAHCENNNPSSPEKWKMIRSLLFQVFGKVPDWDDYVSDFYAKYGF